jgi:hypothetical protein
MATDQHAERERHIQGTGEPHFATGANARQVGGEHYAGTIQHWDIVVMHNLDYFQGQITKYVMRCWKKNGIQDLEKALHFLEKYIEVSRAKYVRPMGAVPPLLGEITVIGSDDPIDGSHRA